MLELQTAAGVVRVGIPHGEVRGTSSSLIWINPIELCQTEESDCPVYSNAGKSAGLVVGVVNRTNPACRLSLCASFESATPRTQPAGSAHEQEESGRK